MSGSTGLLMALAGAFAGLNLAWAAWRLRRVASKEDRDSRGMATIIAAVPVIALVVVGRLILNPLFRLQAKSTLPQMRSAGRNLRTHHERGQDGPALCCVRL